MQPAHHLLSAVALAVLSTSSFASATVYTSSASFLTRVAPGYYTEDFNSLTNPLPDPLPFSGGAFAYTASSPPFGLYSSDVTTGFFLGTSQEDEDLTITFTSGNVNAVGANFFASNISDAFQQVSITITLSDGTVETFTPTSAADSYRGFTSDVAFTSLVISGPGTSLYAGLDNLTVGTAVPEPTSWALAGLALAALVASRRRSA
jgi:hypothetical protein